ncbi:unnamed protein product [Anisakis simplex]|uniref:Uncharacterized protein n=1 Tax=Anisakis simplex TaxID=6269 RepID=A0A0M3KEV3_ANISI|nr:unnamed protein product [Anisakis simplex]
MTKPDLSAKKPPTTQQQQQQEESRDETCEKGRTDHGTNDKSEKIGVKYSHKLRSFTAMISLLESKTSPGYAKKRRSMRRELNAGYFYFSR